MVFNTNFIVSSFLSPSDKKSIQLTDDIGFTVAPIEPIKSYFNELTFSIINVKGDIEFSNVYYNGIKLEYDKITQRFTTTLESFEGEYIFCGTANISSQLDGKTMIRFMLDLPAEKIRTLKLFESFEDSFILPRYKNVKFDYRIQREEYFIKIEIKNPRDFEIKGYGFVKKNKNVVRQLKFDENYRIALTVIFDPSSI